VVIAATQFSTNNSWDVEANIQKAESLVRQAASEGKMVDISEKLKVRKSSYFKSCLRLRIFVRKRMQNTFHTPKNWKTTKQ